MSTWHDYLREEGNPPDWPYPVQYDQEQEIDADILVLGGGIAGCWAAIGAAREGLNVVLVEKGDTIGWITDEKQGKKEVISSAKGIVRGIIRNGTPVEKGMKLGAFDYLMKPVKIDALVRVLLSAAQREEGAS